MKAALEILGIRTYHAFDLWVDSEENVERWNRAMTVKYQGKGTFDRMDWDHILGQYSVSTQSRRDLGSTWLAGFFLLVLTFHC